MRQHSGDFVICLEEKFLFQNCIAPQKGGDSRQTRKKARRILGVLRAFLTPYGVDKRLFEAIYHYGALPKPAGLLLLLHAKDRGAGGINGQKAYLIEHFGYLGAGQLFICG